MLVLRRYGRTAKEIRRCKRDPHSKEDCQEEMPSRNIQSLSYEDLCICLDLILPPGFKLPKFNTFDGKRNPITIRKIIVKVDRDRQDEEYALRWRLEASRIRPPLPEKELISTFIRIQEELYLEKLFGACPQMPSSSRQSKKRKSRDYTQLREPLSDIFSRLRAIGVIQQRKEKVVDPMHPQFDPSKRCAFHSNAQGHDIEECVALKHKVQNLIDANKLQEYQSKERNTPIISNKEKQPSVDKFPQKRCRFKK
ncbi:hypothetical protein HAX54_025531 [Datura stramonium]|uniref:Uncharacterized protein n=1 Tax=Datura stramonium TaxID=4076 RepID=A0ABS8RMC9_DATST|nr:hypothetical protein [Datura stramonium]